MNERTPYTLAGRYFHFHLWRFTVAELGRRNKEIEEFLDDPLKKNMEGNAELQKIWSLLSELSGFPGPHLANRLTTYRRWSTAYSHQLIREDIRDLTGIKNIGDLETLHHLPPSRVGSPLSAPSLARGLHVSCNDNEKWVVEATVPDEVYTDRAEFLDYFYDAALNAARRRTMFTVLLGQRRMGKTEIFKRVIWQPLFRAALTLCMRF